LGNAIGHHALFSARANDFTAVGEHGAGIASPRIAIAIAGVAIAVAVAVAIAVAIAVTVAKARVVIEGIGRPVLAGACRVTERSG
jgi:hypothetical protein